MIEFIHPEHLHLLWAVPAIILFYGLLRYLRRLKAQRAGIEYQTPPEDSKFTITNGWFICSVFTLVYIIFVIGLAAPIESEESSREYDSKKVQMMLAFDTTCESDSLQCPVSRLRSQMLRELDTLSFRKTVLNIGAVASGPEHEVLAPGRDFEALAAFIDSTSSRRDDDGNFIADVINECELNVDWDADPTKRALVILTDRTDLSRPEIDAAKNSAKNAAKKHIFTYVVGVGPDLIASDFHEIVNSGKGVYIDAGSSDTTLHELVRTVKKNKRITFVDVLNYFLLTVFFLITPSLAIFLCKRYSWLGKLGPIMVLYGVGMLLGSVKINGASLFPNEIGVMQDILSTAMVPLAIPLMLYSCVFNKNEIGKYFKAMVTGLVGVVGAVTVGYFICGSHIQDANKVAGMLTGVYTGGTINMAAIKESLQADNQTYILMQTYDIVVCLAYIVFLLLGGFKLFRKWLRFDDSGLVQKGRKHMKKVKLSKAEEEKRRKLEEELRVEEVGFRSIFTAQGFRNTLYLFGTTIVIILLSALLTLLISGGQLNMTIFFLLITTFGILASYIKSVHNRRQHYNLGLYCIYIFSLVIATMADFDSLRESLTTDIWLPSYMVIAVFGSLLLTAILGKIFKVDADTMVITSVTYINSPAFVPMIAAAMRNRNVLIPGLTIGVIGFAVGNYLGTFLAFLLP